MSSLYPDFSSPELVGSGRVVLILEYDGSCYHGWQAQKTGVIGVQQRLQEALACVAGHSVEVVCAGRTDAGVHGSYQVVHFDTEVLRTTKSWVMGANANLPDDISVLWVSNISADFHARFTAVARRYRYVIYNHPVRPAGMRKSVTWNYRPLDADKMHSAAQCLIGEHDFTSYRAVGCQSKTPFRCVEHLRVKRLGNLVVIDIQANAFLHHMVRNIAGVLMTVGAGKAPESWVQQVLQAKDRTQGGVTAHPYGLYLVDVIYPSIYQIPKWSTGPAFIDAFNL
ncbi:MAG: tRNA pseudouridine(38-40) synthase TruA [Hahellaceae bacterium]|nr:tRNA pseudouridine(38-40) synthase TruA [Hahellaceae bacterium]